MSFRDLLRSARSLAVLPLLAACGGSSSAALASGDSGAPSVEAGTLDASSPSEAAVGNDGNAELDAPGVAVDGSAAGSQPCPTSGVGGIDVPGARCVVFPPTATGADPSGENASVNEYALAPNSKANGQLVLFFNGSGGHPANQIASPTQSFYGAAVGLGYHVLAVSYLSNETIAMQCACADACYLPSRESIVRGVLQTGAAADLKSLRVDEGISGRAALALRFLAQTDPSHGWSAFLTSAASSAPPEQQIDWTKVVAAGHSQGGGHAAVVGKLFPVARVVQLSSTCDAAYPGGACVGASTATPATWTSASNGTWRTPASVFWGLDIETVTSGDAWVSGDGLCFLHAEIWQDEGLSSSHQDDQAATCGASTSLQNHDASIACAGNYAQWQAMLK